VPLAGVADWFVVEAMTEPSLGWAGLACFVVPRDEPGVQVAPHATTEAGALWGTLRLDNVRAPDAMRLADPAGRLGAVSRWARRSERLARITPWLSLLDALCVEVVAAIRARQLLGRRAAAFQTVRAALVELRLQLRLAALQHELALSTLSAAVDEDEADRRVAAAALLMGRAIREMPLAAEQLAGQELSELGARLVADARRVSSLDADEVLRAVIATGLFPEERER
jgi:alkylation response protein AidB-like acyl-CoA dehydrogenase